MTTAPLQAAEAWFRAQGLPYFVAEVRSDVRAALRLRRIVPLLVVTVAVAAAVALGFVPLLSDDSDSLFLALGVVVVTLAVYALVALRLWPVLGWATAYTFRSLGLMVPLVTKALPLLLLFLTFLFINTEVWQVASGMSRPLLWTSVFLFGAVATLFLLVRLPEEVRDAEHAVVGERLVACCAGTPMESAARGMAGRTREVELDRMPRANLVLALLFAQAVQVLSLAVCVYAFFLLFGSVTISDDVVRSWLGHAPTELPSLARYLPVSNELVQVSTFLAAFAGLYFTVYAVSDPAYREQFFTRVAEDLERAIGVHTVYETLRQESAAEK